MAAIVFQYTKKMLHLTKQYMNASSENEQNENTYTMPCHPQQIVTKRYSQPIILIQLTRIPHEYTNASSLYMSEPNEFMYE